MKISEILVCKSIALLWFWVEWKANLQFLHSIKYSWTIDILKNDKQFVSLDRYDLLIKSPWISKYKNKEILLACQNWKLTSSTEIFLNNAKWKFIWITWTKWKSTVSTLIFKIFLEKYWDKVELVWNIWNPIISHIFWDTDKYYIIEFSSYQIEDLKWILLDKWVLINVFPDHQDYHNWFENYKLAKENIFNISKEVIFLKNWKYFLSKKWINKEIDIAKISNIDFSKVLLKWEHNKSNIIFCLILAHYYWIGLDLSLNVIYWFRGLDYRLQETKYKERIWINDSISTTPESTLAWVKVYEKNLEWIILGWNDRWYDFSNLIEYLSGIVNLKAIALLPENDKKNFELIKKYFKKDIKIIKSSSMPEIVEFLFKNTSACSAILLSTASPSYNLYKNYMAQWDDFIKCVKNLF